MSKLTSAALDLSITLPILPNPCSPNTKSTMTPLRPAWQSSHRTVSSLVYHAYTVYLFSCNNIKDIICMGFTFGALNASIASHFSMGPSLCFSQILGRTPAMLLWSWSNLFLFNLHNQRHASAIAEDAINKPWRPLPAGRLSSEQATILMYLMYPIILGVAFTVGGLGPCLLEMISCVWYNEWGGASQPFVKNLLNGAGFACFLAGPFEVATGYSIFSGDARAALWLLILAFAITTVVHAQDFRDIEGDTASGRMTVPLYIGDMNARILLAAGVAGWTSASCSFWGLSLVGWNSFLAWAAGTAMAGNFFRDRTREGDTLSWKLFPLWMVGLFLLPISTSI